MIEINLLPDELKKQHRKKEPMEIDVSRIPWRLIGIICVVALIALQALGGLLLAVKTNSLKGLDIKLQELDPNYKVAQSLKLEMRQLNSKLSAINELTSKSIIWSKKMSDLSQVVTEGIWLNELALLTSQGPKNEQTMLLTGSAISYPEGEEAAILANFINSLKSHLGFFESFQDIQLDSSQMRKIGTVDVMDFKIICFFNKGRSYFDKSKR